MCTRHDVFTLTKFVGKISCETFLQVICRLCWVTSKCHNLPPPTFCELPPPLKVISEFDVEVSTDKTGKKSCDILILFSKSCWFGNCSEMFSKYHSTLPLYYMVKSLKVGNCSD